MWKNFQNKVKKVFFFSHFVVLRSPKDAFCGVKRILMLHVVDFIVYLCCQFVPKLKIQ